MAASHPTQYCTNCPSALTDRRPIGVWEKPKARSHSGPLDKRRAERRLPHCPFIALKSATTDNMSDKIVGRQLEKQQIKRTYRDPILPYTTNRHELRRRHP
ncbi:hypothetical protein K449DRAFT_384104 [Hypoxylon sp. EC38]|nr:hypothetical protein K449DRAFT_384104 [Hypoxylon sp. EC38]